ncbi:MAG TPA: GMC family oxidoreductase N-terminal domain-containing protein [Thermoleophilaceae bacterium]|nr:GMC family oxidoreductase N-terminal domain-containing protein [Thermoleophilaceae bacterium]
MKSADYVIVGAGSAGCVLANRLSEDPDVRVLLLEAGGKDRSLNIKIPAAFANQFHTKLDWDFATEPEPACDGRSLYIPRGKTLGGSSSMNAMLYVRGRPLDYDLWEAAGATGWGWASVLPYFLKAENNERGASEFHAVGGPLNVADQRSPRPLDARILAAAEAIGIPRIDDYNGPEQDGASMFQVTQRGGRRWSTADGYLRPAMGRSNLEVVTGAHALGLDWEGDRAAGVRYSRRGRRVHNARAEREVILAAGTFGSPQLLLLSGIGPPDELREAGVQVRHELPGVGQGLQDHPYVTVLVEVSDKRTLYGADKPKPLAEWLLRRTGPLTSTAAEVTAFVRTRPGLPAADLSFHMGALYFDDHGASEFDGHAATLGPVLVGTRSRGRVWLRSSDPYDKPRILTNTLAERDDVDSLVAGVKLSREMAASPPLADTVVRELKPGAEFASDDEIEASVRRRVELLYHPVGTCAMGPVLDPELRVRGVQGLRVVDASVMPSIPGGNTNAPTIMVAERTADLIRGRPPLTPAQAAPAQAPT